MGVGGRVRGSEPSHGLPKVDVVAGQERVDVVPDEHGFRVSARRKRRLRLCLVPFARGNESF